MEGRKGKGEREVTNPRWNWKRPIAKFFLYVSYLISSSFFLISMLNKMIENKRMNNSDPIFS